MPRDHTRIHLDIWGDDDWLDLSPAAQHLYFVLYTWPPSLCGAGDWQPRKIAARAKGWQVPSVLNAGEELVNGGFVLIDLDTEEYLIRSWVKHDGLYRVQNMAISVANARANLASRNLRGVVVHEVAKLRKAEPNLDSWTKDPVKKMLDQKAVDPSDTNWPSPWVSPSASPWVRGNDSSDATGKPSPSASTSPTPSPTPTPNSYSQEPPYSPLAETVETEYRSTQRDGAGKARARFASIPSQSSALAIEITQQYADIININLDVKTRLEIQGIVDSCLQAGQQPAHIAAGMKAWGDSDSWSPTQIPKFITKAAAQSAAQTTGEDKADGWLATAYTNPETQKAINE